MSLSESYKVDKISKEIPIKVEEIQADNKTIIEIREVKDIEFEIVSTGYIDNTNKEEYKIKATIVLKTSKIGNDFITIYSVVAYNKI